MKEPFAYLAYAAHEAQIACALYYFTAEENVYGWYVGAEEGRFPASYFMLENFYSVHNVAFYRSRQDDVYDGWAVITRKGEIEINRPVPVPDRFCHELEHLQDMFVREWLFYAADREASREVEAYRAQGLPLRHVNIKAGKLNRLNRDDRFWTYATPGLDLNVISYLKRHWWLDYTTDERADLLD